MSADCKDVELRIRGAQAAAPGEPTVHAVEIRVQNSGLWKGVSRFHFDALDPADPAAYGAGLGRQLVNPALLRALDQAGLTRNELIRLRLVLDDDASAPHWIRWERLCLPMGGADVRLAIHNRVLFSRYIPVELPDGDPPASTSLELLLAVSNPAGLDAHDAIEVERELAAFASEFENGNVDRRLHVTVMPGRSGVSDGLRRRITRLGWDVADGPASLQQISNQLHRRGHALHLLAHGDFDPSEGTGSLLLESETGGRAVILDNELQAWVTPDLQLVVFQSCLSAGATAEGQQPFTGLAPRLVRLGVPAAVAMQDVITMDDARVFFGAFYRSLLDEGLVDVAVNQGRRCMTRQAGVDNWSIPALFSRLRGGRLWHADPLREAVVDELRAIPPDEVPEWPSLQVVEHRRGMADYDPVAGATGPRFDLWERIRELAASRDGFAVLSGPRGSFKAPQLRRLYRTVAQEFCAGTPDAPLPVLVTLAHLSGRRDFPVDLLRRLWSGELTAGERARVEGRRLLFLVDGEVEVSGLAREQALAALNRLRALPDCTIFVIADELMLPMLTELGDAVLLIVQPLEPEQVMSWLARLGQQGAALLEVLRDRSYHDFAGHPRLLKHMLDLSARGVPMRSRRMILERVAAIYLARMETLTVPRACAEEALERIAWHVQNSRTADLSPEDLYPILNAARGGREFSLIEFKRALVGEALLLVSSGDESVRFAYAAMQAYFAARYLANAPDRRTHIENVAATLGHLGRMRRWQGVIVLLAGMLPHPGFLLRTILSGSSLMEGEQLFLAVHCYQEAVAEHPRLRDLDDVVDQMIDTLIWRSTWDPARGYADRRKALDCLAILATLCAADAGSLDTHDGCEGGASRRYADIIPHLVTLACDKVPTPAGSEQQYDWTGIRQVAAICLSRLPKQTTRYVERQRPDLVEPLRAWWELTHSAEAMRAILYSNDPRGSVIAAFALAQTDDEGHREMLRDAYDQVTDPDVKWGIVNAMTLVEAPWIDQHLVRPWIESGRAEPGVDARRAAHTCYLIQKTRFAAPAGRDFLRRCLLEGPPVVQGRAIRALGKLQDPAIEVWLRPLCEQIVRGDLDAIDAARMRTTADGLGTDDLQRAGLECLRDIGTHDSIEIMRRARRRRSLHEGLRVLNFQTAEELYWRLTRGLVHDTASTTTAHER